LSIEEPVDGFENFGASDFFVLLYRHRVRACFFAFAAQYCQSDGYVAKYQAFFEGAGPIFVGWIGDPAVPSCVTLRAISS
jgi:hypothetical protein